MTFSLSRRKLLAGIASSTALASLCLTTNIAYAQTLTLKVGATAVPHAEILEFIKPILKQRGVKLEVLEFSDYVLPNRVLEDKEIDANFYQHKPYLDTFNQEQGTHLIVAPQGLIHIEPFGAYSKKITTINDLKQGSRVALPNDPTNGARALLLLHNAKIITLKDPSNLLSTSDDLKENPKNLHFIELEAVQLPRILDEVDLALINTNYALQGGLNPLKDALLIEDKDSPYANVIATHQDNVNNPALAILIEVLHSEEVKQFILENYKGAIVPVF